MSIFLGFRGCGKHLDHPLNTYCDSFRGERWTLWCLLSAAVGIITPIFPHPPSAPRRPAWRTAEQIAPIPVSELHFHSARNEASPRRRGTFQLGYHFSHRLRRANRSKRENKAARRPMFFNARCLNCENVLKITFCCVFSPFTSTLGDMAKH